MSLKKNFSGINTIINIQKNTPARAGVLSKID